MKRNTLQSLLVGLSLPLLLLVALVFMPRPVNISPELADVREQYQVEILRDSWGVPHIFGHKDKDAAFGLAYAHAEDDFLTIQQSLLAARGRLATVYGMSGTANDYMVQLLRVWDVVNAGYERDLSPEIRALHEAYADGLNTYAALHPQEVISAELFPLSGKDIVAGAVHKSPLFFGLDETLGDLFKDERQSEVSGRPQSAYDVETQFGSNTFAVGPSRTTDGSTFFAVNSHQPWTGPVAWYEAHVHSDEGWDAVGGLFPASPVIIHGHNRHLGWAFTVNHPDLSDVYVLEMNPQNPNQYRFDGAWRDLEVRMVPITVRLLGNLKITVKQETLWSVYGPTVRRPHGVYALRYAGYGKVNIFEQLYRMNKATHFKEWQEAMREGGLPNFNVGYADDQGHIYYLYNAMLPIRQEGYDWSLYLPGDTSQTLWTETLPFDRLPQVLDPAAGFVQNANSTPFLTTIGADNPDPNAYSPTLGIETRMSNRAKRLRALFGADDAVSWDDFVAYKFDMTYAEDSDLVQWVNALLAGPVPDDPQLQAGLAVLRDWDHRADPANRGTALAVLMWKFLAQNEKDIRLSNETEVDVPLPALQKAFAQAVDYLLRTHGRLDPQWQEVNRLQRGDVNLGLGGGPDLLHAVYGDVQRDGWLRGNSGDSYVMLVRWRPDGSVESYSIHQFGAATLRPHSPHYADQAPLFVRRQLKPVWMDEADIRAHLERAYRPGDE